MKEISVNTLEELIKKAKKEILSGDDLENFEISTSKRILYIDFEYDVTGITFFEKTAMDRVESYFDTKHFLALSLQERADMIENFIKLAENVVLGKLHKGE